MLSGLGAAALSTIGSGLSTLYANKQNVEANVARFNAETELANTAHQREVNDLRLAGLNPILSAGGAGASVPHQDAPKQESLSFDAFASAMSSAANAELATANANRLQAEIAKSAYLERFYQTPLGKAVIQSQALKDAAPSNPVQAAGMAGIKAIGELGNVIYNPSTSHATRPDYLKPSTIRAFKPGRKHN